MSWTTALKTHWPEYLMEAALLGLFMISACFFTVLLEYPASPVHPADTMLRRTLSGIAMGLTAVALIYSPWGKQSGAHMNPSVTLTFLRLGKVQRIDAIFYVLAQFAGGTTGVALSALVWGSILGHPSVNFAATQPGDAGVLVALAAEFVISFLMMSMVLRVSNHTKLAPATGLFAGMLVALYITFESPYSGMSMNPARTLASAFPGGIWRAWWIYFTAPPLGMQLASEVFLRQKRHAACAKLIHPDNTRCIFCGAGM